MEARENGGEDSFEYWPLRSAGRISAKRNAISMTLFRVSHVCLLVAVLAFVTVADAQTAESTASKPTYNEVFESVWKTVNENFFDPGFVGKDWERIGRDHRAKLGKVTNDTGFLNLVNAMLRELPVSHLTFSMPQQRGSSGIGIGTRMIDSKVVVSHVFAGSDAQRKGIQIGDVIIGSSDLTGPRGTMAIVRLRGCDGRERRLQVRRESHSLPERPSIRWRTFTTLDGKRIGYIRAVRFDDDAAPLIDAAMAEMKNTIGIIIDVRDNTGGNMSFARLSSYFVEGEHLVAALLTRGYVEKVGILPGLIDPLKLPKASRTYTDEAVFAAMSSNGGAVGIYSEDVGSDQYKGKVAVLISGETASAAEGFAWHMKLKTGATLIGGQTAGALLGAEYFTLAGGWRLAVPTHAGWGPDGKPVIDQPVLPHSETKWTVKDLCRGNDPDMSKAVDLVVK